MKESYTVKTWDYALSKVVDHDTDYNWRVVCVLRKRYRTISAVKQSTAKHLKHMHKFGIEVLKMVAEAIYMDENNGDKL